MNDPSRYHGLLYGEAANDRVGAALAVERWDTDTPRDILVGAAGRDGAPGSTRTDAGAAFVVRGRDFSTIKGKLVVDEAALAVHGGTAGAQLGKGVAFTDFDNDGSADLLFGLPLLDGPAGTRADAGAVLVLPRERVRTGTAVIDLARMPAAQLIHGRNAGDQLGSTGWLAVGKLSGGVTRDVVAPSELGDGPADNRASAGEAWIVPQADQDRDGALDSQDTCFPTDPTKADPGPTGTTSTWSSQTTFNWSVVPNATSYNFYRGTVVRPWVYNWTCLQKNLPTPVGHRRREAAGRAGLLVRQRRAVHGLHRTSRPGQQRPEPSAAARLPVTPVVAHRGERGPGAPPSLAGGGAFLRCAAPERNSRRSSRARSAGQGLSKVIGSRWRGWRKASRIACSATRPGPSSVAP